MNSISGHPARDGCFCGPPLCCCCSLPSRPGAGHSSRILHTKPHRSRQTLRSCSGCSADAGADTVWIYEQGGPRPHAGGTIPCSSSATIPVHDAVLFAQVPQTLTIDDDLISRHRELSFEELQAEVDVSIEILHRVIEHFKEQGKQVVVVGTLLRRVPHPPATCGARGPAPPTVI